MGIDPRDLQICAGDEGAAAGGPVPAAPPIVQTSLFAFPDFAALLEGLHAEHEHTVYTRGRNPTVMAVERKLAALERGEACLCFASGMAAISAVMLGLLRTGDHVLFVNQVYGPTLQLARHVERFGVQHDVLLDLEPDAVAAAIRPSTRLVWLESPGTMVFRVLDIAAIAHVARERGALVCIDNSWSTPLFQKPIELGADIVVHTGTKYLGGHSDVMAGALITSAERAHELFHRALLLNGGILAPFDAWLLYRSLRTLPVRMLRHQDDALRVATFLRSHPAVRNVLHPAFTADSDLVDRQMRGFSGLFSFEPADAGLASVHRIMDGLKHFRIAVSWGGVESIVISPERGDPGFLEAQRIPRGLIRLSIGLEGADLLIEDLDAALKGSG